jgi:putative NADPH-quinone reductase
MNMQDTVVIVGHPDLNGQSLANRIVVDKLKTLDKTEVRILSDLYPDYRIDVAAEQAALVKAQTIVLQFPFHWYSVPGLLKKWIDDVLAYGFAYGSTGTKLQGKNLVLSFTVGGPEESYGKSGYNSFTIKDMLPPLIQTANLCGMKLAEPVYSHSMVYIPDVYNIKEEVEARAIAHGERLVSALQSI